MLAIAAKAGKGTFVLLVAAKAIDTASVLGMAYVSKRIIDAIVDARAANDPGTRTPLLWVVAELLLFLSVVLAGRADSYAHEVLRQQIGLDVNVAILKKAANVAYGRFEDPKFLDKLSHIQGEATDRSLEFVVETLSIGRYGALLVGVIALLISVAPIAIVFLAISSLAPLLVELGYRRWQFEFRKLRFARTRKLTYLANVMTTSQTAKEVKLFGIGRWLRDKYSDIYRDFFVAERRLEAHHLRRAMVVDALTTISLYGFYAWIVVRAVSGSMTLGALTLTTLALRQGHHGLRSELSSIAKFFELNLFASILFEYLDVPDDEPDLAASDGAGATAAGPPSITLEDVTFRYPDAERDAVSNVSLTIRGGETVALVGKNGAGKTTIVKLLAGLYRPTSGCIRIDGVDIAEMPAAELRNKLGVIFQDFARYEFTAAENVGIGWLPALNDGAAIERAVENAGAEEVVKRLPHGLDTPLGRAFGGDDLSGGQWQRIALARAFMRKSAILILDEPTASIDVEGEQEIFRQFQRLKANRTAILITHRFSTVRMADRVVVFEDGRLVEEGPHADLAAAGGPYAMMFKLQAEAFRLGVEK
jgi:ATP-binding cassette, subfamily B, bacterial